MVLAPGLVVRSLPMTTVAAPSVPVQGASREARGLAIRGGLLLLVGLVESVLLLFAFRIPNVTAHDLGLILGIFMLADGGLALIEGAGALSRRSAWLALVGHALAGLALGMAVLVMGSSQALRLFAVWAIVTGVLDLVHAPGRTPGILAVLVSVAFGLLALAGPIQDPATLLLVAVLFAVIAGGLRLGGALQSR